MLKTLEEPPAKSIFIFCTTDPQKIPKTILSRVQRYDFQRISQDGIVQRLSYILASEEIPQYEGGVDAINYIAKLSEGGLRDAITLLDKCLSYSTELTVENVVKALGVANYDVMFSLLDNLIEHKTDVVLGHIDSIYKSGIDMKQFIRTFTEFVLDVCKYGLTKDFGLLKIPNIYQSELDSYGDYEYLMAKSLLNVLIELNSEIRWDTNPKYSIEAKLFIFSEADNE